MAWLPVLQYAAHSNCNHQRACSQLTACGTVRHTHSTASGQSRGKTAHSAACAACVSSSISLMALNCRIMRLILVQKDWHVELSVGSDSLYRSCRADA